MDHTGGTAMNSPLRMILFGPPGVGKGTQAKLLSEKFNIPHISTGDMLRAAATAGTDMGKKAKVIMDEGRLVPDDVMIGIVRDVLASPRAAKGFILDGFPRTLPQAKALSKILDDLNMENFTVVVLEVDDEEIIRRLGNRLVCEKDGTIYNVEDDGVYKGGSCPDCGARLIQRDDDAEQTVRERLRVYHSTTAPVFHYYDELGVVLTVDGGGSIDMVNREINLMLSDIL